MYGRLILGAAAAFLAIMLWSKTRDAAWMLIVIGIIAAYIETACSTLELPGIALPHSWFIDFAPLIAILLTTLRMIFFTAALLVMVIRRYKNTEET